MYSREGADGAVRGSVTKNCTLWLLVRGIGSFVVAVIVTVCGTPFAKGVVSAIKPVPKAPRRVSEREETLSALDAVLFGADFSDKVERNRPCTLVVILPHSRVSLRLIRRKDV